MKIAITSGVFDCLDARHFHLIKEMRKAVLPDGRLYVLLLDDYPEFCLKQKFPIQPYNIREKNLMYLVPDIRKIYQVPYDTDICSAINKFQSQEGVERVIYFDFDTNKNFHGVEAVKACKIPIKFIKLPKQYEEAKNN